MDALASADMKGRGVENTDTRGTLPRVSVIVPVKNERDNLSPLIDEIAAALVSIGAFEIIYVDDGSTDGSIEALLGLRVKHPYLRVIAHKAGAGKSAALHTGAAFARGEILAVLDGDGENDPSYLTAMIAKLEAADHRIGLVQGERQGRKASAFKRAQSRLANAIRRRLLNDSTRDTGCGMQVFYRDIFRTLPYFSGLHRFMAALVKREGYGVLLHPVIDRQRFSGRSHYGFFDRLWVGMIDMAGVWWLIQRRGAQPEIKEVE